MISIEFVNFSRIVCNKSNPRLPRLRFKVSAESDNFCNSSSTNTGTIKGPSKNPVFTISKIRPSITTDVSRTLAEEVRLSFTFDTLGVLPLLSNPLNV